MELQIASIVGALCVLGAYVAHQRRWVDPARAGYNLFNLIGALLLLWVAVVDRRAGFIFLEAVWALVSIPPLVRLLRVRQPAEGGG